MGRPRGCARAQRAETRVDVGVGHEQGHGHNAVARNARRYGLSSFQAPHDVRTDVHVKLDAGAWDGRAVVECLGQVMDLPVLRNSQHNTQDAHHTQHKTGVKPAKHENEDVWRSHSLVLPSLHPSDAARRRLVPPTQSANTVHEQVRHRT